MERLGDNLKRLLGLHNLTARDASANLKISQQAISELQSGKRTSPRYRTIQTIAEFFEVPSDRLAGSPFEDLLAVELADPERYQRVEAKIKRPSSSATRRRPPRRGAPHRRGVPGLH